MLSVEACERLRPPLELTRAKGNDEEALLRDAVARIRLAEPGLVAKQVHAVLLKEDGEQWGSTTVSEVKRICSKLAKAEVAEASGTHLSYDAHKEAEQHVEVKPRDVNDFKMARPGLPSNHVTLHRGDRLGTAAERGDTQQVKKLLKKGVDPNFQNAASGVTPLGVACERGHRGVVEALLDAKASPEVSTAEGFRCVHSLYHVTHARAPAPPARAQGHRMARARHSHDLHRSGPVSGCGRPLHISAQFGQDEIVRLLVGKGRAEVNARCPLQDTFALLLAINFDFVEVARTLLAARADPNMGTESRGITSLHVCYSAEAVELLVAAGASVNANANLHSMSPLHSCVQSGAADACLALLAARADPTLADGRGLRPVELAVSLGRGSAKLCAHAILGYIARRRQLADGAGGRWPPRCHARLTLLADDHCGDGDDEGVGEEGPEGGDDRGEGEAASGSQAMPRNGPARVHDGGQRGGSGGSGGSGGLPTLVSPAERLLPPLPPLRTGPVPMWAGGDDDGSDLEGVDPNEDWDWDEDQDPSQIRAAPPATPAVPRPSSASSVHSSASAATGHAALSSSAISSTSAAAGAPASSQSADARRPGKQLCPAAPSLSTPPEPTPPVVKQMSPLGSAQAAYAGAAMKLSEALGGMPVAAVIEMGKVELTQMIDAAQSTGSGMGGGKAPCSTRSALAP